MTLGADIATYWLTDPEAVTITYTSADGASSVATAKAKRAELSYRELQFGGPLGIEATDQVWIVGKTPLGALTFERGGTITDSDSVVWRVLSFVPKLAAGEVVEYRAVCRQKG